MAFERIPRLRPFHELLEFQRLLAEAKDFYLARTRGIMDIMHARRCTPEEAREFAREVALSLSANDYAKVSYQYRGPNRNLIRHDAYVKIVEDEGWFLKIGIVEGGPHIGACHLTLEAAETVDGTRVPKSDR